MLPDLFLIPAELRFLGKQSDDTVHVTQYFPSYKPLSAPRRESPVISQGRVLHHG